MTSSQPTPGLVARRHEYLDPMREKERRDKEAMEDCEESMRKYLETSFGPLGFPTRKKG
jgi:hypothetical protein